MGPLAELLGTDERQALTFFAVCLGEVCEPPIDRQQLLYNASILAHYALVSTQSATDVPAPATLADVFDNFVMNASLVSDSTIMETAAAQCLLLAGFFEDQMRQRHNIRWYAELGAGFFRRAADLGEATPRTRLLLDLADAFEPWRQRHARLSRELRDRPYVIAPPRKM
jgi:hypothetical protein